jgi:hypothetical protein
LSDVQGLLLTELFELYHRSNISLDPGRGVDDLVSLARNAGLFQEGQLDFEDLSFDHDSEWRKWGHNEERKRYVITQSH